jgi:hypothetical protein
MYLEDLMIQDYLEKEWWLKKLSDLFPENYGTPEPSWKLNLDYTDIQNTHWYKKGFFLLGITYQGRHLPPIISVRVIGRPDIFVKHPFNMQSAEEEFSFIESLSNPDFLFPLCVNISQAQPFIEYYFKNTELFKKE